MFCTAPSEHIHTCYLVNILRWLKISEMGCEPVFLRLYVLKSSYNTSPVVDPGFPLGGGANSSGGGGAPTYDFAKFSQKTAWNWKNFDRGGARVPSAPLRSATAHALQIAGVNGP